VLAMTGCLLILDTVVATPFVSARSDMFDRYQQQWPPERAASRTAVVAIDEESIHRFGQWPWPRDLLATLVSRARGARATGLDVLMPDADRLLPEALIEARRIEAPALRDALLALPRPDAVLEAAIQAQPTVLAMTVHDQDIGVPATVSPVREQGEVASDRLPRANGVAWPLPILAQASAGVGLVSAPLTVTGGIDRLPVGTVVRGTVLPGFGAELLRVALNAGSITLQGRFGVAASVWIDGVTFPVDPSGAVRPRFAGAARLTTISAQQLLDSTGESPALAGKIVVIGVTAPGVGETFRVPLGVRESSPVIQAEMIESVLAGDTLWRPFWAGTLERVAGLAMGLAGGLFLGRVRYRVGVPVLFAAVLLLAGGSVWAFRAHGILLDWIFPSCCLVGVGLAASVARTSLETTARRRHEADLAVERVRRAALEREVALRTEADRLRQSLAFAVDAARLGVWDADLHSGAWHHSPRHDAILGLTRPPRRWSADILLNRVVPEDREAVQNSLAEGLATGSLQLECGIRRPDGTTGYVHILGRFWEDAEGAPSRVAGVVVDITKPREMELRMRQGEKMQAIGLLAGGVAHNFNNLLTVVLGNLELASSRVDASSRAGILLGNASEAARKSAAIAGQLLAFARLQPLNPKPVDAAGLLDGIVSLLRNALPSSVTVVLDMAPDLGTILIDPVDLELALLNLAINARDAMPGGGRLVLHAFNQAIRDDDRLGIDGDFLVLEVRDSGEGMSAETRSNVFKPFFTTKPVGQGTGLGLSQVYGFVHQSGGAVDIESVLGQGTCVRLYLPLIRQDARPAKSRQNKVAS
jgi:signal transduction histidine kinase